MPATNCSKVAESTRKLLMPRRRRGKTATRKLRRSEHMLGAFVHGKSEKVLTVLNWDQEKMQKWQKCRPGWSMLVAAVAGAVFMPRAGHQMQK